MSTAGGTRLNKLLSQAGIASRRAADDLISQGRVEVNGHIITELGTRVDPARDDVRVDGRRIKGTPERRYLLLNKPRGVVSTRSDPQQRTTVIDLLARAGVEGYFYPVGRLDFDSEGLIIITNDGDFAERVTHPRYQLERTYEAMVEGVPDQRDLDRLRRGIEIDGRRTAPATVRLQRTHEARSGAQATITITIHEGRNRQVRYMCDAIAHPVVRLRRTHIGAVEDRRLKPGAFRDLTPAEVRALTPGTAKTSSDSSRSRRAPRRPRAAGRR